MKSSLLAVAGVAVGVLTLRAVRSRRAKARAGDEPESQEPAEVAREEAASAVEHVKEAAGHTRVAGENVVEYARQRRADEFADEQ